MDGATINPNLTYNPIDSSAPNAYPITSPTWIIAYKGMSNTTDAAILRGFLNYCLTTAQTSIAPKDNYAALPTSLAHMAIAQLEPAVTSPAPPVMTSPAAQPGPDSSFRQNAVSATGGSGGRPSGAACWCC